MTYRFLKEYYNFTAKRIKEDSFINPGIRAEIARRLDKIYNHARAGMITLDEAMRLISLHGMREDENMEKYALPGWEPGYSFAFEHTTEEFMEALERLNRKQNAENRFINITDKDVFFEIARKRTEGL